MLTNPPLFAFDCVARLNKRLESKRIWSKSKGKRGFQMGNGQTEAPRADNLNKMALISCHEHAQLPRDKSTNPMRTKIQFQAFTPSPSNKAISTNACMQSLSPDAGPVQYVINHPPPTRPSKPREQQPTKPVRSRFPTAIYNSNTNQ